MTTPGVLPPLPPQPSASFHRPPQDPTAARHARRLAFASGGLALAVAELVLLGWALGLGGLTTLVPGWASMKPMTALSFGLLGASLLLQLVPPTPARRHAGLATAGVALLVGLLASVATFRGAPLFLDTLLFPAAVEAAGGTFPGRMSGGTAWSVTLLAIGLLSLRVRPGWWHHLGQAVTLGALGIGALALEGYLFNQRELYHFSPYGSMAIHTALLITGLALGTLAATPGRGVAATWTSGFDGGRMVRLVLPAALLASFVMAWLMLRGQQAGYYDPTVGLAILMLAIVAMLAVVLAVAARQVNAADQERRAAEDRAREAAERWRLLSQVVETSEDAILTKSLDGIIRSWNRAAEEMYGFRAAEIIGEHISRIVPADRREELDGLLARMRRGDRVAHLETQRLTRDGRRLDVSVSLSPIGTGPDRREGVAAIGRDITARKRAERLLRESEERLQTVLENLTEGVVVADMDGALLHWNRAGLAMHDFTDLAEGLRRLPEFQSMFRLATPDGVSLPFDEWPLNRVFRGETFRDWDLRLSRVDRDWERIFSYGGTTVVEPGGRRLGVLTITDVTARRQAEEQFRLVVEASPTGMVLVARDGTIRLVNSEAERQFGWPRGELVGQPVDLLVPEGPRGEHAERRAGFVAQPTRRAMGSGRPLFARRRDGSRFPAEIGLTPLRIGHELAVLAVVVDITERVQTEEALARHQRELERSNRELAQFAYVASHDLQEPLRMVASFTQLFAEKYGGQVDEKGARYIHFIVDGAERMQELVRDLLAYARVDAQGKPLVPTAMGTALTTVTRDLGRVIEETGAEIRVGPLPEVWADPGQLRQLLQNLLGNALKFRSSAPPLICIEAERDGACWRISVTDNGIGIEPEFRERVFGMFQRLHARDEYAGSGIGLAIAQRIVERHGGRIWVEDALAAGTRFGFTLHATDAPTPEVRVAVGAGVEAPT